VTSNTPPDSTTASTLAGNTRQNTAVNEPGAADEF
jgi:hypothetical protein